MLCHRAANAKPIKTLVATSRGPGTVRGSPITVAEEAPGTVGVMPKDVVVAMVVAMAVTRGAEVDITHPGYGPRTPLLMKAHQMWLIQKLKPYMMVLEAQMGDLTPMRPGSSCIQITALSRVCAPSAETSMILTHPQGILPNNVHLLRALPEG